MLNQDITNYLLKCIDDYRIIKILRLILVIDVLAIIFFILFTYFTHYNFHIFFFILPGFDAESTITLIIEPMLYISNFGPQIIAYFFNKFLFTACLLRVKLIKPEASYTEEYKISKKFVDKITHMSPQLVKIFMKIDKKIVNYLVNYLTYDRMVKILKTMLFIDLLAIICIVYLYILLIVTTIYYFV